MVKFTARRSAPELVAPARPTPRETKVLSDVDDCYDLRFYSIGIEFLRCRRPGGRPTTTTTPAKAVKAALAEALVHYYPIAGRLREAPENKLVVDCTGEGVVFVEASADVGLEEFGRPPLRPPYPCVEELFCDAGDTKEVVGKPLFFIQVTELIGGGFVLGFQACHSIVDGFGLIQFIKSIADLARGEAQPAVLPVWERQILMARTPPRITDIDPAYTPVLTGSEYDADRIAADVMLSTTVESMAHRYLLFGPREIAHLREFILPSPLAKSATAFELLTAVMWRCRTMALGYEMDTKVRLIFTLNARGRWKGALPIPRGYYGNALVYTIAETTVGCLCGSPLGRTVELIRKAKTDMSLERMRSTVDMMALLRGRPTLPAQQVYWVSDISHIGDDTVDFGWAEWVGGGMPVPKLSSFHTRCKDGHGEESVTVSVLLPGLAMDKFAKEIASWLIKDNGDGGNYFTLSSL